MAVTSALPARDFPGQGLASRNTQTIRTATTASRRLSLGGQPLWRDELNAMGLAQVAESVVGGNDAPAAGRQSGEGLIGPQVHETKHTGQCLTRRVI